MGKLPTNAQSGLTWKDKQFAHEYVRTGDPAAGARATGSRAKPLYQKKIGYRYLKKPGVKAYIESLQEEVSQIAVRDTAKMRDEVHVLIDEGVAEARKGDPIIGKDSAPVYEEVWDEKKGAYTSQMLRRVNTQGLFKGAELKGKILGMFTDVQRIEGEMEGKSAEELGAFLKGAASDEMVADILSAVPAIQRAVTKRFLEKGPEWIHETFQLDRPQLTEGNTLQ